jgi:hypothetical protein
MFWLQSGCKPRVVSQDIELFEAQLRRANRRRTNISLRGIVLILMGIGEDELAAFMRRGASAQFTGPSATKLD